MSQNAPLESNPGTGANFTSCKNCHSPMPSELRFCRNCGYRLGEGTEEYTETVRFQDARSLSLAGTALNGFGRGPAPMTSTEAGTVCKRKKRFSGISWIFIAIIMFFVVGGIASQLAQRFQRQGASFGISAPRSYFGVDGFKNTEGGVTFGDAEPPGGPADKAGLIGGDVITTFDGQKITDDDEMMDLLGKMPIGKTVEVVFIRDGDVKTTTLTTMSKGEFDQLANAFRRRPEGQGRLGIDNQELVEVPGTKLHGVKLGTVDPSMSAALAGIKDGDIVIDFGGTPIRTVDELSSRIRRAVPFSTIDVVVMRGDERLTIPVKIGGRR